MTDDDRDPDLADALSVPPLDELTRRRLVHGALEAADGRSAAPTKRSWMPLVAAVVVILLVVGGIVALGRGGDDSSSDTAARRPSPTSIGPEAATAEGAAGAGPSPVAGTADYGDLGDLSSPAARSRARAKVAVPTAAAAAPTSIGRLLSRVADASCADRLRADGTAIVGLGTASVDGHDAVVVVTTGADGAREAYVLVFAPCELHPL